MIQWLRKRPLPFRILAYIAAAALAFAIAGGVGAIGALMLRGDLGSPRAEQPQPPHEQQDAARSQQKEEKPTATQPKEDPSQLSEAEYVARVGDVQANAVERFLDSHNKILRYDALTTDDIDEMQANQDALQEFTKQVGDLNPPQRYGDQYEAFSSAINELHAAAELAHSLAADPTAASQSGFDEYDRHVNEAAAGLQRSNEILGRDYETIEGVQRVNPLS
jgi:hypothetical protein